MENGGQINRGGHLTAGRCTTSAAPKEASSTCTGCGSIRATGRTVGPPIRITSFHSPAHGISPHLANGELSVGPRAAGAADRTSHRQHLDARQRGQVMALQAGSRLGPYEILSLIGAGGMGEVYQARDTRLDRKVAVKVLAPELASDAEFRARFEREAKAISALNHPHICGLYDIGREHDTEYLVLELLEGETLAARLERGPLPLAQVLRFGIEIADALEAAHRHGIVHRDLKPGNIMLTAAGTKLLDFGLAKHTVGAAGQALSMLATAPGTGTAQGTIIGTLQYMAPEQVQGAPADARTDIFALGTILYEMATGRRAFEAKTQASLIAKILETDVPAVSTLAPLAPPALDHVVQGCLAKEPADRWQTAHDVKLQLQWIQAQGSAQRRERGGNAASEAHHCVVVRRRGRCRSGARRDGAAHAVAKTGGEHGTAGPVRPDPAARDPAGVFDTGAISPDGQRFVFEATVDGREQLMVRDMASTAILAIPGTEGGFSPFWSPDSRSVAFFVLGPGQLKTVSAHRRTATGVGGGGRTRRSQVTARGRTAVILFGSRRAHLSRGRDRRDRHGSRDAPVEARAEAIRRSQVPAGWPTLPRQEGGRPRRVCGVASMSSGTRKILDDASSVAYAAGYLFYSAGNRCCSRVPLMPNGRSSRAPEVEVTARAGPFSVSDDGIIVYRPSAVSMSSLTWFDRNGRRTGTLASRGRMSIWLSRRAVVVWWSCEPMSTGTVGTCGMRMSRAASSRG